MFLLLILTWISYALTFNIAGNEGINNIVLLANELSPFFSNKTTALKALENNHNTDTKYEDVDTLYLIGATTTTTSTSHSANKRQTTSTSTSASNSHRPSDNRSSKKM